MPIFKMQCNQCSNIFETLFKNSTYQPACPSCGATDLKKLPSEIAVVNHNQSGCSNADFCPNASPCCCGGKCGGHR